MEQGCSHSAALQLLGREIPSHSMPFPIPCNGFPKRSELPPHNGTGGFVVRLACCQRASQVGRVGVHLQNAGGWVGLVSKTSLYLDAITVQALSPLSCS